MAGASASETRRGRRYVGLDVARCLALLGMMATHVLAARADDGSVATLHWVAGGRASALFAVLAGVSMALVAGGRTPVAGASRVRVGVALAIRAVLVGALGLLLGALETGLAVILTYYAVLFLLGLPFLGLRARPLLALAAGWAVVSPVVSHLVRPDLPARQFDSPAVDQLADPGRLISELLLTGYYSAVPWLAYLLLGLAIGRLDLGSRRMAARLVAGGLVAAVGATLLSRALTARTFSQALLDERATGMFGQTPTDDGWRWLLVVVPHSTTPFDLVQTAGSAALAIGACLLVVGWADDVSSGGERFLQVLFGAGTMSLSLYTLHVVMRTDLVPPPETPESYFWHVLLVLGVGGVFVALGRRGPLEVAVGALPRAIR